MQLIHVKPVEVADIGNSAKLREVFDVGMEFA